MQFSLSTSYFAGRLDDPGAMAAEAKALGFDQVELGYFTRDTDLPVWEQQLPRAGLTVSSIHAYGPIPIGMPQLGPEVFSLADPDGYERAAAQGAMRRSLDCAVAFGARAIVNHGGRVALREPKWLWGSRPYRSQLSRAFRERGGRADLELAERERGYREAAAGRWLEALAQSLEVLLPHFEAAGVFLAFENLPGLEAFPDPAEMAWLRQRFPSPMLAAWYDIGHGERKARVGDWPVAETLEQTLDFTCGCHIHDVRGLEEDHVAPGEGTIDFRTLLPLLTKQGLVRVFEPAPAVGAEALRKGRETLSALVDGALA